MARKRVGAQFWNSEYEKGGNFRMSREPSEDFVKFLRFLERGYGRQYLNPLCQAVDVGCGNGRNLLFFTEVTGGKGYGVDISSEAIAQACALAEKKKARATFVTGSIIDPIPLPDHTQALVIDAMVSHILSSSEREVFLKEVVRVLRHDGWYFFKTFLLDGDQHAARMLKENPGPEAHTYIHPDIGVEEHVFSEEEIYALLEPYFTVHKVSKSYAHLKDGRAYRRRSISIYAQRKKV